MRTLIEYYVGIDNSHSGAIAVIDGNMNVVDTFVMPITINASDDKECNYNEILNRLWNLGCHEGNTRIMLEEPQRFASGKNAIRIMWSCFQRILVGLECNGMKPDCILSISWQCKMLKVFGDSKSKVWAQKRVDELFGDEIKNRYKNKKEREGVNDALLIADFCRRSYLSIAMPAK